jgi:Glyoxalase-like domain
MKSCTEAATVSSPPTPPGNRQLPIGDEIFLDHVGHFVRNVDAATRALERVGFAPTPKSIQVNPIPDGEPIPTGTGNVTAMLARGYMEVLFKAADTPLGQEFDDAIQRYEGVHLIACSVADAAKAHKRLSSSGFRMRAQVDMERPVETLDGPAKAAFSLARVSPGEMAEGRIQILTHHTEAAVWQRRWLVHRNGALALAGVMIAVPDADEAAQRFTRFTGRPARASALGHIIELDRGRIDLVRSEAFSQIITDVYVPRLPFIGAYTIIVRSLAVVEQIFSDSHLPTRRSGQTLIAAFPNELGYGVWMFVQAASA